MFGDRGKTETRADEFLPYLQHIGPQVVALDDGSIMAMAEMPGIAFELEEKAVRNSRPHRLNSLLQMIGDDNVTMHVNFVHGDVEPVLVNEGQFQTKFARDTYQKYVDRTFGSTIKRNSWLISFIVHPRYPFEGKLKRLRRQWLTPDLSINEECERQLEDIMEVAGIWLAHYGFRRLGYRPGTGENAGFSYTEIGEALALIMTTRPRVIPTSDGLLGGMVYADPVIYGHWRKRHTFTIELIDRPLYGMILSYKEYPNQTRPGMFNELLGADAPIVLTHSFRFLNRATAQSRLSLKAAQMANAEDKAKTLLAGLTDLQDQVASNLAVMGSHHCSVAIYADDQRTLANRGSAITNAMAICGATVVREARGAMGAYFSQLPGVRARFQCRPGAASSRNLSHFVSLEGYPEGDRTGYWGPPIVQFKTNGGTAFNWHLHVGEVGHTCFWGMTGLGKTLMLSFVMCALQRSLTARDTMIVFDKDQGMQVAVMANGGSYVCLRRGSASGSAPLRVYDNTPRNVGHLAALFRRLIMLDGRGQIEPGEDELLHRGVAFQLRLPKHLRSMLGVRAFLGTNPVGAGARFAKWCRGGSNGWLFDNDEDFLTIAGDTRLAGIDFTDLLPNEERPDDGCASAMAADVMFRFKALMDGRRFVAIVDECRYYMDSIAGVIEDFALTGRKKELVLMLAAQKPSHILERPMGKSIMAQVPTDFIFPDSGVKLPEYGSAGLGCTPAEFDFIKDLQTVTTNKASQTKRRVLIRRHGASVVVEFDLSGMEDEIAILSGRPDTATLLETIAEELGPHASPDDLVAAFKARWRTIGRISRLNSAKQRHAERRKFKGDEQP